MIELLSRRFRRDPRLLREQHFRVLRRMPTVSERFEDLMARLGMLHRADGLFYNDLREPCIGADIASVTLATTLKALYPASNFPVLGGQYFSRVGKKVRIRVFGRITTAATPGNVVISVLYGTGADANGVTLASSAAQALTASQSNMSFEIDVYVHCRSIGSTGTLFCTGKALFNEAVVAPHLMIPATAPAVSGSCDLTASLILSVQMSRSGNTAETAIVHDMEVTALN